MQASFANVTQRTTDWQSVSWRRAFRLVKNLRQRIFKATRQLEWKRVRNLQRLLLKSYSNVLIAVRRVTQINPGKRTPGIDKLLVKTGHAKAVLVDALKQWIPWQPFAARRVYIPKSNSKRRPLGIPSIIDRCLQAMVKTALEPCWEAQFEPTSYGFRPGRSAQDAIARIYVSANPSGHKKWALDADITFKAMPVLIILTCGIILGTGISGQGKSVIILKQCNRSSSCSKLCALTVDNLYSTKRRFISITKCHAVKAVQTMFPI